MRARRTITLLTLLVLVGSYSCGGGSSSSGGGGGTTTPTHGGGAATPTPGGGGGMKGGILWPLRGGGTTKQVPPSVQIGRVVFESQGGSCCVAVNPPVLSGGPSKGLAILTNLPVGPATVTLAGFSTKFAPVAPGILAPCESSPPDIAIPCDPVQLAAPAFESPPLHVIIIAGAQTNLGSVPIEALPFLYDFSPGQDANAPAPVQFALTPVDAVTGIQQSSIALEVSFMVPDTTPSTFRTLTKRVPLSVVPCADQTDNPCSTSGNQSLDGFKATGTAPPLPEGPVNAHFTASNLADPPANIDFTWPFNVLATPTETGTPLPTPTAGAAAANGVAGSFTGGGASPSSGSVAGGQSPGAGVPPALPASSEAAGAVATPTATPTPDGAS